MSFLSYYNLQHTLSSTSISLIVNTLTVNSLKTVAHCARAVRGGGKSVCSVNKHAAAAASSQIVVGRRPLCWLRSSVVSSLIVIRYVCHFVVVSSNIQLASAGTAPRSDTESLMSESGCCMGAWISAAASILRLAIAPCDNVAYI